jgi:hypothetical protein
MHWAEIYFRGFYIEPCNIHKLLRLVSNSRLLEFSQLLTDPIELKIKVENH